MPKSTSLSRKLKQFQPLLRGRLLLLSKRILTHEEYAYCELAVALIDWDTRHENYGTFYFPDQEIAKALGLKSRSSANSIKKRLIAKGFLSITNEGRIKFERLDSWLYIKGKALQDSEEEENQLTERLKSEEEKSAAEQVKAYGSVIEFKTLNVSDSEPFKIEDLEIDPLENVAKIKQKYVPNTEHSVQNLEQGVEKIEQNEAKNVSSKGDIGSFKEEGSYGNTLDNRDSNGYITPKVEGSGTREKEESLKNLSADKIFSTPPENQETKDKEVSQESFFPNSSGMRHY